MAHLAEIVTREQVINSLEYLINHPELKLNNSAMYDLIYKGKKFPPVEVLRWAAKLAGIPNWEKFRLTGGTGTRGPLENMGIPSLIIVPKKQEISPKEFGEISTMTNTKIPLNTILYGPPGTGKTYHTIDKALKIIDPEFYEKNKGNRKNLTSKFRSLLINDWDKSQGQIAFVTFHQSMSYEDFIEGIKPVIRAEATPDIQYEISDGIFKKLCHKASRTKEFKATIDGDRKLLTKELFEEFYYSFSQELPEHSEKTSFVTLKTKEGYPFDLFRNGVDSIIVKAGEKRTGQNVSFKELWAVLNENKNPTYKSYEHIIIEKILEGKSFESSSVENQHLKFVLIIDEINRGNISQIFGELITLIEDDKRQGAIEELMLTLPYSKMQFTVPKNIFIIGTMNTADRSVEALDTALRRRFSFEEMRPMPELLSPISMLCNFWNLKEHIDLSEKEWMQEPVFSRTNRFYEFIGFSREKEIDVWDVEYEENERRHWFPSDLEFLELKDFTGINLQKLLTVINNRLERLLSKDHQIGHAFFINVFSIEELANAFYQKVIPQLQEYFYGDYGKIGLVLGKKFIEVTDILESEDVFAEFDYEASGIVEKPIYNLRNVSKMNANEFMEALELLLGASKTSN